MDKLNATEVNSVLAYVNITSSNFTHRDVATFFPQQCGVQIDPDKYTGNMKQRFEQIVLDANPEEQSKILEGVLNRWPLKNFEERYEDRLMTEREYRIKSDLSERIKLWIEQLRGGLIEQPEIKSKSMIVKDTLDHAEILIERHSYTSAVDRVHTALHGYLKELCEENNIEFTSENPNVQEIWGKLKVEHPSFSSSICDRQGSVSKIVGVIGRLLHNMNDIRNNNSFSHPNEGEILDEKEAKFIINLSRVMFNYIDSKV